MGLICEKVENTMEKGESAFSNALFILGHSQPGTVWKICKIYSKVELRANKDRACLDMQSDPNLHSYQTVAISGHCIRREAISRYYTIEPLTYFMIEMKLSCRL